MKWFVHKHAAELKLRNPILITGLPGIGNTGKIAVDFLVEELKAEKYCDFFSFSFPQTVFVNEESLVELPNISLYSKKFPKADNDLLFLTGDVQPTDEVSCYEFCDLLLDMLKSFGGNEVITLAGIGLQDLPKEPKVYCTGNSKKIIARYCRDTSINPKLYGVVGPIIGVSGVLVGLADRKNIEGISFLVETLAHPMFLGVKGAKELLGVLTRRFKLKLDVSKMEREVEGLEKEAIKKTKEIMKASGKLAIDKLKGKLEKETNYIG